VPGAAGGRAAALLPAGGVSPVEIFRAGRQATRCASERGRVGGDPNVLRGSRSDRLAWWCGTFRGATAPYLPRLVDGQSVPLRTTCRASRFPRFRSFAT
jgi:hypothetical protein